MIASQLVDPSKINVNFGNIAGLDDVIESLRLKIILPLTITSVVKGLSEYYQPPKGVLLYGPPGCGKTMLAKAIAKEANARFLSLEVPSLTNKWYGESQKLSTAVFTLAQKVQPCIIFIDEIDTFLRSRNIEDHEATAMMKAQFMILWDGLQSENNGIIVLGATNRPHDVDIAILRRMPVRIEISLPSVAKRKSILQLLLDKEKKQSDIDYDKLAELTNNFTCSDLKELCRNAVFHQMSQKASQIFKLMKDKDKHDKELSELLNEVRGVSFKDFELALESMAQKSFQIKYEVPSTSCKHAH